MSSKCCIFTVFIDYNDAIYDNRYKEYDGCQEPHRPLSAGRRISEALNLLVTLAAMTASDWRVTDEIERLRSAYEYMSRYALDGIEDPERENVYLGIVKGIRTLADRIVRQAKAKDASTIYFDAVRYSQLHPEVTMLRFRRI